MYDEAPDWVPDDWTRLHWLREQETIEKGQADDCLAVEHDYMLDGTEYRTVKVWLSRIRANEGEPFDNKVTIEILNERGAWEDLAIFPARRGYR